MQKKKKRKLSKHKELERAKKLEEEKNDPEEGEAAAKKQLWKAAMDRASGIKVHDDPKLLEKSIRKEKKKQQKNKEKWKERIQTQDQLKAEKQQKRSDNISERIHHQKMRKIAKREKKLLRPSFEGRKEGFITEGTKSFGFDSGKQNEDQHVDAAEMFGGKVRELEHIVYGLELQVKRYTHMHSGGLNPGVGINLNSLETIPKLAAFIVSIEMPLVLCRCTTLVVAFLGCICCVVEHKA
nr:ribosomal RNA-processing protein 14-like [Arachis hypogaea]